MIFDGKSLIFGYERTIGRSQSFSIDIGTIGIGPFKGNGNLDSVKLIDNSNDKGIHISADYRFYLKKENKFEAPRGVYIGPYYAYNRFSRGNTWNLALASLNGNLNTNMRLNINTIGAELGYQFILWKRFSVDLVMVGPGVGFYNIKTSLDTDISEADQALVFEKINDYLNDKIPGYDFVIKEGEFKRKGSINTTSLGYRYIVNIGFRF
jgi:hypothetical protein